MTDTSCLESNFPRYRPLWIRTYAIIVFGLAVAGLLISLYLALSHYRIHTDIGYQSFCALSKAINCDTVSQSPYSVVWNLPVAIWGVGGYIYFLILIFFSGMDNGELRRIWSLCFVTAILFSLASGVFAWISVFCIKSLCILCIGTYAINFLLLYFTWIIRRRFHIGPIRIAIINDFRFLIAKRNLCVPTLVTLVAGFSLSMILFPNYWTIRISSAAIEMKTGLTDEGHPWIGAEQPELEIVEFTDYLCFQCKKMHQHLRKLVSQYPDKIRLVHRNYPMDHKFNPIVNEPFHVGAGNLAIFAIYAAATGKFWSMNDSLFQLAESQRNINLNEIAQKVGVEAKTLARALKFEPYIQHLLLEIRQGMKLGITGTPSYLVNGKVYEGNLPSEILRPFIEKNQ